MVQFFNCQHGYTHVQAELQSPKLTFLACFTDPQPNQLLHEEDNGQQQAEEDMEIGRELDTDKPADEDMDVT